MKFLFFPLLNRVITALLIIQKTFQRVLRFLLLQPQMVRQIEPNKYEEVTRRQQMNGNKYYV